MKLGGNEIAALRLGSAEVSAAYLGATQVWPSGFRLAGDLLSTSALSGVLSVGRPLAADLAAASTLAGAMSVHRALAGASASASAMTGDLSVYNEVLLAGDLVALSALSGGMSVSRALSGAVSSLSALTGAASVGRVLTGAAAAFSALGGAVRVQRSLSGALASVSAMAGSLTVEASVPTVVGTNSATSGNGLTLAVPVPTGAAGDLIVVVVTKRAAAARTASLSGYTPLYNDVGGGNLRRAACFYKVSDGTETTATVDFAGGNGASSAAIYRLAGASLIEGGAASSGTSTSVSFSGLSPSWGAAKTWWLAVVHGELTVTSSPPSGYANQISVNGSGAAGTMTQDRSFETATETPGSITLSAGVSNWRSYVIGVKA